MKKIFLSAIILISLFVSCNNSGDGKRTSDTTGQGQPERPRPDNGSAGSDTASTSSGSASDTTRTTSDPGGSGRDSADQRPR